MLIFLDAHIECNEGWLQPLIARIASDRSVVAVPFVDYINCDDFSYRPTFDVIHVNGFFWTLLFNW